MAVPQSPRGSLSKAEVLELVKSSVPNRVVAETVERYGIAFKPSDEVINEFRKAGADDAVISAMRGSWRSEPIKPLSDKDILLLLAGGVRGEKIVDMVQQRGIGFQPTDEYFERLRSSGAKDELVAALRTAAIRPFSRDLLLESLGRGEDAGQIGKGVHERGIDFDPTEEDLAMLRAAGASESLLRTIRGAKRVKQPVKQVPNALESMSPSQTGTNAGVTPPLLDYNPEPAYTLQARHDKLEGEIQLRIVVDSHGNVTDAQEISKPLGDGLDESAIETVKTWTFKPATHNGVPVPVRVTVVVNFRLYR